MERIIENINPEPMNADDLHMLRMIDSYSQERVQQRADAIEACGIESQRLLHYQLGVISLTTDESELLASAQLA